MFDFLGNIAKELGLTAENGLLELTRRQLVGILEGQRIQASIGDQGVRVTAFLSVPLDLGLSVGSRTFGFVPGFQGSVTFGDSDWDEEVSASADEPERAKELLVRELRVLILRLNAGAAGFGVDDTTVTAFGQFDQSSVIDTFAKVLAIGKAIEQGRPDLRPAGLVAPHFDALTPFARAHELTLSSTPLTFRGAYGGAYLRAACQRSSYGTLSFDFHFTPVEIGPERGLRIRPTTLRDRAAILFGGQDVRVGDDMFDSTFRVECLDARHASVLLDPATRASLLELHHVVDELTVDDNSLILRSKAANIPADRMVSLVESGATIAARAARIFSGGDGPYR